MVESENSDKQNSAGISSDDQTNDQKELKVTKKKTAKKKAAKKKVVKKKATKKTAKKKSVKKQVASRKKAVKKTPVKSEVSAGATIPSRESAEATEVKIQLKKPPETAVLEQSSKDTLSSAADEQAEKRSQSGAVAVAVVQEHSKPQATTTEPLDISPEISEPAEASTNIIEGNGSTGDAKIAPAELIIKAQSKKEDEHMASTSNGSAGFLPKVIFWLLIVIIGFSYIRSLAKHPGSETGAVEQAESSSVVASDSGAASTEIDAQPASAEQTTDSAPAESVAPTEIETAPHAVVVDSAEGIVVPAVISNVTMGAPPAEEPATEPAADAKVTEETVVQDVDSNTPVVTESSAIPEAAEAETTGSEQAKSLLSAAAEKTPDTSSAVVEPTPFESTPEVVESTQAAPASDSPVSSVEVEETSEVAVSQPETIATPAAKPYSQKRSESATQILKEFDELRKTAEQERKAMYEMMQKRREMQESMMPRSTYPRWNNPNYPAYNAYPQGYYPYGYPQ